MNWNIDGALRGWVRDRMGGPRIGNDRGEGERR